MFAALLISVFSSFGLASAESLVLHCEPSQIRPWPANARVDVVDLGEGHFQLRATTEYYGVDLGNQFNVTMTSGAAKTIYASDAAHLIVLPNGSGQYWSKDDGLQDVVCKR